MRFLTHVLCLPVLALAALPTTGAAQVDPTGRSILFIRGADGSGGLGSGSFQRRTEHLSSIHNTSQTAGNHGFGELAATLRADGFTVSEWVESGGPLTTARLQPHRVVVFGSNNRVYTAAEVAAFHAYMDAGGSALFVSDANWGPNFDAAPTSDNQFLGRYGLVMHQDSANGIPVMQRSAPGRFVQPGHPALAGPDGVGGADDIQSYEGEGVSYLRVERGSNGWISSVLVSALGFRVRPTTGNGSTGSLRNADARDGALVVAQRGDSLILGHYDRNSWFNRNGTGSNLYRRDNRQLALNIFRTLASVPARAQTIPSACGIGGRRTSLIAGAPELGRPWFLSLQNAERGALATLVIAAGKPTPVRLSGSCIAQPDLTAAVLVPLGRTSGAGSLAQRFPLPGDHRLSGVIATAQAFVLVPGGPLFGNAELTEAVEVRFGFPR